MAMGRVSRILDTASRPGGLSNGIVPDWTSRANCQGWPRISDMSMSLSPIGISRRSPSFSNLRPTILVISGREKDHELRRPRVTTAALLYAAPARAARRQLGHVGELPRHLPIAAEIRYATSWSGALQIATGRARWDLHREIPSTP